MVLSMTTILQRFTDEWSALLPPDAILTVCGEIGLFHAGTRVLLKLVIAPLLIHDLARVQAVHPSVQPGDVLVADRGLCSYAHLALLVQAACMPCSALARDRWWISRRVGPLSCRVSGGRRRSKVSHALAGSKR